MGLTASSPEEYVSYLPAERRAVLERLRSVLKDNLPKGMKETMAYGMIGFVIPPWLYPPGYQARAKEPLPFMSLASQKNHIALHHMGIYAFPETLEWFREEYTKRFKTKLDAGKGCLRFKKLDTIPYDLIAELCRKITVEDYLSHYDKVRGH